MKQRILCALTVLCILAGLFVSSAETAVIEGKSDWTVEDSSHFAYLVASRILDGDIGTYWHSNYTAEDGKVVSHDEPPFFITITLPEATTISGFRYTPRQDSNTGIVSDYELYAAPDDSSKLRLINKDTFSTDDRTPKDAAFGCDVTVKKLVLAILLSGGNYGTMAEFDLLAPTGGVKKTIDEMAAPLGTKAYNPETGAFEGSAGSEIILKDKSSWLVTASSEMGGSSAIRGAFDNNPNTFWHSKYTAEDGVVTWKEAPPFDVVVIFPGEVTISGLSYLPRTSGGGNITAYSLYGAADDDGEWIHLTDEIMEKDTSKKTMPLTANLTVKRLKITVTETSSIVATAAEIDFLPANEALSEMPLSAYAAYEEESKLYAIDRSGFSITGNTDVWAGHEPTMMIDGGGSTFWQTVPNEFPYVISIDMNAVYTVRAYSYSPRQSSDMHGLWNSYIIYASVDGDDYFVVDEVTEAPKTLDTRTRTFDAPIRARYWEIVIDSGVANRASCSELRFYQKAVDREADEAGNRERYTLTIGSPAIRVEKGEEAYEKTLDVAPFIYAASGTTLIPLRGLFEEMGAQVSWNGEEEKITVATDKGNIEMRIQDPLVYVDDARYGAVRYTLIVAPKIRDSRTFIPLRFVSEQMGYTVTWNGEKQEIVIEK